MLDEGTKLGGAPWSRCGAVMTETVARDSFSKAVTFAKEQTL